MEHRGVDTNMTGLSVPQAAQALGVSTGTICRWADMAYLGSYRTNRGQRRFSREQIDHFISQLDDQHVDPLIDRQLG